MPDKEVRFRKLVDSAGKPEIVSLWADPKRDQRFMKAIKEHRVLTIIQEPRTHKKQFGKPGFHQDPYASYLVFPKPLPVDAGARVIGINYDLAAGARITGTPSKAATQLAKAKAARVTPQKIPQKNFTVILQRTGVVETSVQVQARNASEAEEKALATIKTEPFDGSKAVIKNQVRSVQ